MSTENKSEDNIDVDDGQYEDRIASIQCVGEGHCIAPPMSSDPLCQMVVMKVCKCDFACEMVKCATCDTSLPQWILKEFDGNCGACHSRKKMELGENILVKNRLLLGLPYCVNSSAIIMQYNLFRPISSRSSESEDWSI